jgi:ATP-binding cassette subfamily B protein
MSSFSESKKEKSGHQSIQMWDPTRRFAILAALPNFSAVIQDFIRLELPLPTAWRLQERQTMSCVLASAGATNLAALDTAPARGYNGDTDLSGGPWQRVALARALVAVTLRAGVVLLD